MSKDSVYFKQCVRGAHINLTCCYFDFIDLNKRQGGGRERGREKEREEGGGEKKERGSEGGRKERGRKQKRRGRRDFLIILPKSLKIVLISCI